MYVGTIWELSDPCENLFKWNDFAHSYAKLGVELHLYWAVQWNGLDLCRNVAWRVFHIRLERKKKPTKSVGKERWLQTDSGKAARVSVPNAWLMSVGYIHLPKTNSSRTNEYQIQWVCVNVSICSLQLTLLVNWAVQISASSHTVLRLGMATMSVNYLTCCRGGWNPVSWTPCCPESDRLCQHPGTERRRETNNNRQSLR